MTPEVAMWVNERAHIAAGVVANVAGWISGFDTGAVITGMTAIVGLGAYAIKVIGNAITEVRVNRDKLMSGTMSDQIDRLNQNLEDTKDHADANKQLADTAEKQAQWARATLDLAEKRIADQQAMIDNQAVTIRKLTAAVGTVREIKATLSPIPDQLAENKAQIAETTARMDAAAEALTIHPTTG